MNSGLPGHDKSYGIHSPAEMVLNMRNLRMSTETEKQKACQYNNIHYIALALIITRLSGTPFDEYLQKNIFNSLDIRPFLNVMDAKETGRLSDGWLRSDIDYEVCAKSGGFGEACLGVPRSIGYWLKGDGLYRAGPGGMMMCGNDMVRTVDEQDEHHAD
jgi:CubicO group peptidase (beta-lactamase class C family)